MILKKKSQQIFWFINLKNCEIKEAAVTSNKIDGSLFTLCSHSGNSHNVGGFTSRNVFLSYLLGTSDSTAHPLLHTPLCDKTPQKPRRQRDMLQASTGLGRSDKHPPHRLQAKLRLALHKRRAANMELLFDLPNTRNTETMISQANMLPYIAAEAIIF